MPALENVSMWHERDISHSSVERVIAPDATITLDFALHRLASIIENVIVYPDAMLANLNQLGGLVFSQQILLALTDSGMTRERAYELVQRNAMIVWKEGGEFLPLLLHDPDVTKQISKKELEKLFDLNYHMKNIDQIFGRIFSS